MNPIRIILAILLLFSVNSSSVLAAYPADNILSASSASPSVLGKTEECTMASKPPTGSSNQAPHNSAEWSYYYPFMTSSALRAIGWAVGGSVDGYGVIVHTNDGGDTWVRQGNPQQIPDVELSSVVAVDRLNVWVVGENVVDDQGQSYGLILRTRDGGHTWERQDSPQQIPDVPLSGVYALNENIAWAVGSPGIVLRTIDGGANWISNTVGVPPVHMEGVYASDAKNVWVVGMEENSNHYGTIIHSSDGGATWIRQPYYIGRQIPAYYLIKTHGASADAIWAVGRTQVVRTTDGTNWEDVTPTDVGGTTDINGVFAVDSQTVWVVGDYAYIARTDDAGETWVRQDSGIGQFIMRIWATDKENAWAVTIPVYPGDYGQIIHTWDGGQTWITQTVDVKPLQWGSISFSK